MNLRRWTVVVSMMLAPGVPAALAAGGSACRSFASGDVSRPLVELYTSEGCSSCPPADRWLSRSFADDARASVLAFHVDYWDRLGWVDRFASHAWTERQYAMAAVDRARVVYTPQIAVQGHPVGDAEEAAKGLAAWRAKLPGANIVLTFAPGTDAGPLTVDVEAKLVKDDPASRDAARLYVALTSDGLESRVAAGENRGATLHHDHVVRSLDAAAPFIGGIARTRLSITRPADGARPALVAFVQRIDSGDVLQTLTVPLDACTAPAPASTAARG